MSAGFRQESGSNARQSRRAQDAQIQRARAQVLGRLLQRRARWTSVYGSILHLSPRPARGGPSLKVENVLDGLVGDAEPPRQLANRRAIGIGLTNRTRVLCRQLRPFVGVGRHTRFYDDRASWTSSTRCGGARTCGASGAKIWRRSAPFGVLFTGSDTASASTAATCPVLQISSSLAIGRSSSSTAVFGTNTQLAARAACLEAAASTGNPN